MKNYLAIFCFFTSLLCNGMSRPMLEIEEMSSIESIYTETEALPTPFYTEIALDKATNNILTPELFGAKGNGTTDDTNALRRALEESSKTGKILFFPIGKTYKVTGPLNFFGGKFNNLCLNLLGNLPVKQSKYDAKDFGGIALADGVKLFCNAEISGCIERMNIIGKRNLEVRLFDTCVCKKLVIWGCNISNFGTIFYDTPIRHVCQIVQNSFLSVFYFSRNCKTSSGMADSTIYLNYINGGEELNDNVCFEWAYYNGAMITNNFIDYYRTIYQPKAISKQAFVGPISCSNHYQVFRYLYANLSDSNINTISFSSTSDAFNWNSLESLEKLRRYKALTYTGKDGKEYEIPPYVAMCASSWLIDISNAKIERNMKSLVFISSALTEYEVNSFNVSFVGNNKYKEGQILFKQGDSRPFYNNGRFRDHSMKIEGIIEKVDALPNISIGWSSTVPGRVVEYNNELYISKNINDGKKWNAVWEKL